MRLTQEIFILAFVPLITSNHLQHLYIASSILSSAYSDIESRHRVLLIPIYFRLRVPRPGAVTPWHPRRTFHHSLIHSTDAKMNLVVRGLSGGRSGSRYLCRRLREAYGAESWLCL